MGFEGTLIALSPAYPPTPVDIQPYSTSPTWMEVRQPAKLREWRVPDKRS